MKETEAYFGLYNGQEVSDKELGVTRCAVDSLVDEGLVIGQLTLDGQTIFSMPHKVKEMLQKEETAVSQYRDKWRRQNARNRQQ